MTKPRILAAGVLALLAALFWASSHLQWRPTIGLVVAAPHAVGGDEPHYLLVINSLLHDRDLFLEDDYRRARLGGLDAGLRRRSEHLDHHTFLVDRVTHRAARWQEAYNVAQPRACPASDCVGFELRLPEFVPGAGVYEVSSHPFAFPAIVAAVLLPFNLQPEAVETRSIELISLFAWLACVLTYLVGRRSGMPVTWALAAALLVGVASPLLAYGRALFPEAMAALALAAGLWAMQAGRPVLVGLACAVALAIKPPFGLVAVGFCAERVWARDYRRAFLIGGVMAIAGIGLGVANFLLARTPIVAGVLPWHWAHGLRPLVATLAGGEHGLFVFVPWTLVLLVAIARVRPSADPPHDGSQALGRQVTLPLLLNLAVLAALADSPGWCWGPRYWVSFMPFLALAVVQLARTDDRAFTWTLFGLALVSAVIAIGGAIGYAHIFERGPELLFSARVVTGSSACGIANGTHSQLSYPAPGVPERVPASTAAPPQLSTEGSPRGVGVGAPRTTWHCFFQRWRFPSRLPSPTLYA